MIFALKLIICGGTGIYDSGLLENAQEIEIDTPYGKPSDTITVGIFKGRKIAFLPRHGKKHTIPPHMINFKANIWAFKELGITRIIAPSAVGSLKEELEPGHFVLPTQFLDFTKSRDGSFSEDGRVIHISVADPFCPELQSSILKVTDEQKIGIHGMTLVPECQLAREAQMCYASISTVTDYDVWADKPVTAKEVLETLGKNVETTKKILTKLIEKIPKTRTCSCAKALEEAEF